MNQQTTKEILARIAELQEIQKRNSSASKAWNDASDELLPLFDEMDRRQKAGDPDAA